MRILHLCLVALLSFGLMGCAAKVGGNQYDSNTAQTMQRVYYGVVESVRTVQIHNSGSTNEVIGTVGGAAVGGIVGSVFGGGTGRTLATLGGALIGAGAGKLAADGLSQQSGYEVTILLDGGQTISVVQGADIAFAKGQRVRVAENKQGVVHVSPE